MWLLRVLAIPLRVLRIRFLVIPHRFIGHLAKEPDYWLKEQLLGWTPHMRGVLLAPSDTVANTALSLYWRRHLWVVRQPLVCRFLNSLAVNTGLAADTSSYARNLDEEAMTMGIGRYGIVARAWGDRPPLLTLSSAHRERGWRELDRLGMPRGSWFVCVQNRTSGFYQQFSHWFRESDGERHYDLSCRDCAIGNYIPAMEAIVAAGGWCVRVGDPGTEPLPEIRGVIDYAHSDAKSEWLDVFLGASCRFFLGCNSGLNLVPTVFGVPVVRVNAAPMSALNAFRTGDLGIPKLVQRGNRTLPFAEVLGSDIGSYYLDVAFERAGATLLDSDPEDIRDCAIEMIETLDGTIEYSEEDARLQHAFQSLYQPHHYCYGGTCRAGREFLRRHRSLLPQAAELVDNASGP